MEANHSATASDGPRPGDVLGFLSFTDMVERLDTLMLEIRHTQVNTIHQLRLPILYNALRFEEDFLWGHWLRLDDQNPIPRTRSGRDQGTWDELFDHPGFDSRSFAEQTIIDFPHPDTRTRRPGGNESAGKRAAERRDSITRRIANDLYPVLSNGTWSLDQKRQYRLLSVLQILKREILRDKVELFRHGFDTFAPLGNRRTEGLGRFLLLRTAIQGRARQYLEHLGDLQAQLARDMDMGLRDLPRPLVERRREQGIYSGFLADRCRDLSDDIASLFEDLGGEPRAGARQVMHRWSHDFTSHNTPFLGDFRRRRHPNDDDRQGPALESIGFIDSSYWMLERPDIQPILAHEIAHISLVDRYDELHNQRLSQSRDAFARLLRTLHHCLAAFGLEDEDSNELRPRTLLIEIAADLLATAIVGPAYLLAMFLKGIGAGLEELFLQPDFRYDLDLLKHIEDRGNPELIDQSRAWYYRLRVACAWQQATQHRAHPEVSQLEDVLTDGILQATKTLAEFLKMRAVPLEADRYWTALADRLCRLVERSQAARQVCQWRRRRGEDYGEDLRPGHRLFPRASRRLPREVRDLLYRRTLAMKSMDGQSLTWRGKPDSLVQAFDRLYLETPGRRHRYRTELGSDPKIHDRPLFQHHYDVPWQFSVMRGIDFLHPTPPNPDKFRPGDWIDQLHYHMTLGREMYQIALDVHYWRARSSFPRLSLVFRLLNEVATTDKDEAERSFGGGPEFPHAIAQWMVGEKRLPPATDHPTPTAIREALERVLGPAASEHELSELRNEASDLRNDLRDLLRRYRAVERSLHGPSVRDEVYSKPAEDIAGRYSAWTFLVLHPRSQWTCNDEIEPVEERLLEKLYGWKLRRLYEVLNKLKQGIGPAKDEEILMLERYRWLEPIDGLLSMQENPHASLERLVESFRDSWHRDGGDPKEGKRCRERAPWVHMISRIYLSGSYPGHVKTEAADGLARGDRWKDKWPEGDAPPDPCGPMSRKYWVLLGVPDVFSIQEARPMCRCRLPQFDATWDKDEYRQTDAEEFPTFFVRRELALPLAFTGLSEENATGRKGGVLGVLSVTLKQRDMRLLFLHRLLRAFDYWHKKAIADEEIRKECTKDDHASLERIGCLFDPRDRIFLAEGWGDILILFSKPGKESDSRGLEERMLQLFQIDRILFQDFQVNRTELSLVPDCIPTAIGSEHFGVMVQVRLMEDRRLGFASTEFSDNVSRNLRSKLESEGSSGKADAPTDQDCDQRCFLTRTPGARMNYTLCFVDSRTQICEGESRRPVEYRDIRDLLYCRHDDENGRSGKLKRRFDQIDIVETTVSFKHPSKCSDGGEDASDQLSEG